MAGVGVARTGARTPTAAVKLLMIVPDSKVRRMLRMFNSISLQLSNGPNPDPSIAAKTTIWRTLVDKSAAHQPTNPSIIKFHT
ncbi:hypothetical protein GCM10017620_21830 [Brevundimonas intermedia]|uniref:Uncharacterized protein n=1 Tax=Brevundimonas intermedia TaxID=74315 RepID=A0ABQ5T8T4_9CAUL|nr:hypothetical protein GCM10017620_21830 [Brevundimonas intermedia]